jgi:hypothetical protein
MCGGGLKVSGSTRGLRVVRGGPPRIFPDSTSRRILHASGVRSPDET